jgi:D-sedoheptulose 7-phosphate isomerase
MVNDIRVLALDIDGVLTDGTTAVNETADEQKRVSLQDLDAVTFAVRSGLKLALVTGEDTPTVDLIAKRFNIDQVQRGAKDKAAAICELSDKLGVSLSKFCYVGDGDRDAPALLKVGLALAPSNATDSARAAAHRVLSRRGGAGAVAEAVDLLLRLRSSAQTAPGLQERMARIVSDSISAHKRVLDESLPVLVEVAQAFISAIRTGHKILLFGNGGSAAEAQHVAGELIGRFAKESSPWPAIALSTDTSVLTAIANDWDYSEVFARQVRGLARNGDVVVGITTSGRSQNILNGLEAARQCGAVTIGFTGSNPGRLREFADICFAAPAATTPRIQELSLLGWHTVCGVVEQELTAE